MRLTGTPEEIIAALERDAPNLMAAAAARLARETIAPHQAQLLEWQGAALYALAQPYDRINANILEIGTAAGYSAAVLAAACPRSHILTLNPVEQEIRIAAGHLAAYSNVMLLGLKSWDFLDIYHGPQFDLVWVDGDHKRCGADLPWFRWLRPQGLMLFHDYSPVRCPPVFAAVNALGERLGREPDVLLMDDAGNGMAGFYRRDEDRV